MSRLWLQDLKLKHLHRLATLVGSYCSGTKALRIQGIQNAVENATALSRSSLSKNGPMSIVSIDMGIKNLAYCSIKTPFPNPVSHDLGSIKLEEWQRVDIAQSLAWGHTTAKSEVKEFVDGSKGINVKESFEPEVYAKYAYNFVKKIVDEHNPSILLIERQRFRSGGGSAVQEWTIRVGMFEAMLYATLRTLAEQNYCDCSVVPISPAMVNRFWLNGASEEIIDWKGKQRQSAQIKKQKVQIAHALLQKASLVDSQISWAPAAAKTKDEFLAKLQGQKSPNPSTVPKLDDLADSLLQGLAWIQWQHNRLDIKVLSQKEFDLP